MVLKPGQVLGKFEVEGKRAVFRIPKNSDLEELLEYINAIIRERACIGYQKPVTVEKEREWLKKNFEGLKKGDGLHILVEVEGKIVGGGGITRKPMDANKHVCVLGITLHKDYRGKGIGKRLINLLLKQAKGFLKCKLVELTYYRPNTVAKIVYEKCGFREVGAIPKGCNYYGEFHDEVIMVREV